MKQPEWLSPTVYSQKAWWNAFASSICDVQPMMTGPAIIFITRYCNLNISCKISNPSIKFGRIE